MRKIYSILVFLFLFSCSVKKGTTEKNQLFEVVVSSDYDGASFKFFEIISQEDEFRILLNDDLIKKYVKKDDIYKSNFLLLNLGEKPSEGYKIVIDKIEEFEDKIVISISEIEPQSNTKPKISVTRPYSVLKINSKKNIEFK